MSKSSRANRFASWCTLVTSGQVASMVRSCRVAASSCTAGETPCALKTTTEPSGTSSVSSTKIAPRVVGHAGAMAREIPEVVRAAAGLAATVLDEARKLPETLPGLPVRLIGLAMQQAMKVQQQYAGFVARGDELFTGLRGENEPGLATFDDEPDIPVSNGFRESAFDRAGDAFAASTGEVDPEGGSLPADPAADAVTAVVDELGDRIE